MGNTPSWNCDATPNFPVKGPIPFSCYRKCPEGYVHQPNDYTKCIQIGTPQPYSRGAGSPLVCPDGMIREANGMCFTPCQKGLRGNPAGLENCAYDSRAIGPGFSLLSGKSIT
jgi:hypothetical protein